MALKLALMFWCIHPKIIYRGWQLYSKRKKYWDTIKLLILPIFQKDYWTFYIYSFRSSNFSISKAVTFDLFAYFFVFGLLLFFCIDPKIVVFFSSLLKKGKTYRYFSLRMTCIDVGIFQRAITKKYELIKEAKKRKSAMGCIKIKIFEFYVTI